MVYRELAIHRMEINESDPQKRLKEVPVDSKGGNCHVLYDVGLEYKDPDSKEGNVIDWCSGTYGGSLHYDGPCGKFRAPEGISQGKILIISLNKGQVPMGPLMIPVGTFGTIEELVNLIVQKEAAISEIEQLQGISLIGKIL